MSYLQDIQNIWEEIKLSFKTTLSQNTIDLWFGDLKLIAYGNNCLTFSTGSEFKKNIINEKYLDSIKERFADLLGFEIDIKIVFIKNKDDEFYDETIRRVFGESSGERVEDVVVSHIVPQNYNFEYTFDNFIVGNSNRFAHAACTSVAASPATNYNPLFIYGPSGIGKTHLMYAIVNEIKKKKPDLKVVYIKCEDFTNELIQSISNGEMAAFKDKYRNCDILLVDDIQFISGKNSTQEEFFHTFNALYEDSKQIIISSDRPPKDIEKLVDRLRSRFEWGIIADIQPPDLELRIAIIKKKAEQVSIVIPDDVLNFLAENLRSNIRQIEGAIKKLSALSFLSGKNISMEIAKNCISELQVGTEPISVTVDKIFSAVFKKYNITKEDIVGKKRNREIADARHISIYLIREITEMSYPNIAKIFDKDHSSIITSYNKIIKSMTDPIFNIEINDLIDDIKNQ